MKTIEDRFLENLRREEKYIAHTYWCLFSVLQLGNKEFLKYVIDDYVSSENKDGENWFISFHKSFRQCDNFDYNLGYCVPILSSEEKEERRQLILQRSEKRKALKVEEIVGDEEYDKMGKRLRELNRLNQSFKIEDSISGYLDAIMWNTIHEDNGFLFNFMKKFFKTIYFDTQCKNGGQN